MGRQPQLGDASAARKDDKTRKASLTFMKFLFDHNFDWSRTGHLPSARR